MARYVSLSESCPHCRQDVGLPDFQQRLRRTLVECRSCGQDVQVEARTIRLFDYEVTTVTVTCAPGEHLMQPFTHGCWQGWEQCRRCGVTREIAP